MQATDLLMGLLSKTTAATTDLFSLKAEPQGNTSSLFKDAFSSAMKRTSRNDCSAVKAQSDRAKQSEGVAPKDGAQRTRDKAESQKVGTSEKDADRKRAETSESKGTDETRKSHKTSESGASDRKEAVDDKTNDGEVAAAAQFAQKQDEANRKLEALIDKLEAEAAKGEDAADEKMLGIIMQMLALMLSGMEDAGKFGEEQPAQLTIELDPDSKLYKMLSMLMNGQNALDSDALKDVKVLLKLTDDQGLLIPLTELVKGGDGDNTGEGIRFSLEPASGDGESAALNLEITAEDLKSAQLVNIDRMQLEKTDMVMTVPLEQLATASGSDSIEALSASIENGDDDKLLKLLDSLGLSKEELARLIASQKDRQSGKLRLAVAMKPEQGAEDVAKARIQALPSDPQFLQSDEYMKSLEAEALVKQIVKGGSERRDLFDRLQTLLNGRGGGDNNGLDSLLIKKVSATTFVQDWLQNFSDQAKQETSTKNAKVFSESPVGDSLNGKGDAQQGTGRIAFLGRNGQPQSTVSRLFQSQSAQPRYSTPGQNVHESVMNQIVQRISFSSLSSANGELRVFLKPGNLGDVHLKIRVEQDTVLAKITASSHEVKAIIESNLGQLKQSLQDQGVKVSQFEVTVDTGGNGHEAHNGAEDTAGDGYNPVYAIGMDSYGGENGMEPVPGGAEPAYIGAEGFTYGRSGGELNAQARVSYLA